MKNRGNFRSFVFNLIVKLKKLVEASDHGARNNIWFFFRFSPDSRQIERNALEITMKQREMNHFS